MFRSVTSHVKPQRGCHGDLYVDLYTPRVKVKPSLTIRVVRETLQQEYMRNSSLYFGLYEEDVVYFIKLTQTPLAYFLRHLTVGSYFHFTHFVCISLCF